MKLFSKYRIARDAINKELEAEAIEKARSIIQAGDLSVALVEKFIKSCPSDTEVAIYPAGGGRIVITRRSNLSPTAELPRGTEW